MELTAQQVNDFLAKAVMESQIGEVTRAAVKKAVDEMSKSYQNPFDGAIRNHIQILIEQELKTVFKPVLEAKVKEAMARVVTDEMLEKIVDAGIERIKSRY
jgi:hypothetical protein